MKTSLLLIGFLLFVIKLNAQLGINNVYNPYLLSPKKKSSALKAAHDLSGNKLDTVFLKNRPLFLRYISKPRQARPIIFADNNFYAANLNINQVANEFDLERTRNRAKQLFFKMKMWRYFRE